MIYKYIKSNKNILKEFFYYTEEETEDERYESYIENIKKDKNLASDFEISAAPIALIKTIIIYRKETHGYSLINIYTRDNTKDKETIMLIYVNKNHFNLIADKKTNIHSIPDEIKIKIIYNEIEFGMKKLKKTDIINSTKNEFFKKSYVNHNRKNCINLYNKIFRFLKYKELPDYVQNFKFLLKKIKIFQIKYFLILKSIILKLKMIKILKKKKRKKKFRIRNNTICI